MIMWIFWRHFIIIYLICSFIFFQIHILLLFVFIYFRNTLTFTTFINVQITQLLNDGVFMCVIETEKEKETL